MNRLAYIASLAWMPKSDYYAVVAALVICALILVAMAPNPQHDPSQVLQTIVRGQ